MPDIATEPFRCSERELFELVATLAAHRRGLTSLQLARESGSSTVVVVPTLATLVSHGFVVRSEFAEVGPGRRDWTYRLTASGRRLLATAAVPALP